MKHNLTISSKTEFTPAIKRVVDHIQAAIRNGKLCASEKLPTESQLALAFSISRITINRGYQVLKQQGLIVQRRGSGSFVSEQALEVLGIPRRRVIRQVALTLANCKSVDTIPRCNQHTLCCILAGIQDRLDPIGGHLNLVPLEKKDFAQGVPVERFKSFDAVMMLGDWTPFALLGYELKKRDQPCLRLLAPFAQEAVPVVTYSRAACIQLAVNYLAQAGFARLGYIGEMNDRSGSCKFSGFTLGLVQTNLDFIGRWTSPVGNNPGEAYIATLKMCNQGDLPQAIVVDTDSKAMEVIRALQQQGMRVPEDISVISYDNITEGETFAPPLTTVHPPRRQIAARAMQMLIDWPIDHTTPASEVLTSQIIVRQSVSTTEPNASPTPSVTLSSQTIAT